MKRVMLFVSLFLMAYTSAFSEDKLNDAQLKLRSNIETFLREEGYMPAIDSDGDIAFKKEGDKYWVIIDKRDTSPFYVTLSKYFNYGEKFNRGKIAENLAELNLKKAVKVLLFDDSYAFQAEMYLVNAENFRHVFYKLMSQLEALEEEVVEICSNSSSEVTGFESSYGSSGTFLVNEDFSSYSAAWKKSLTEGKLSYKNGKMIFEDAGEGGFSCITYDLPKNLKNEDFQLSFSMKATFKNTLSSLFFILGEDWDDAYWFGGCDWNDGRIRLSFGDNDDHTKYYKSAEANLSTTTTHQYTMIKRGRKIEWYADGNLLFSKAIDLSTDMNLMGFLVGNRHIIEVDYLTIKLL